MSALTTAVTASASGAASMTDASAANTVNKQVENYHRILDSIGTPNYIHIRSLFSNDGILPSDTIPAIQVSFEMFEAVQARFSATKSTLERTKDDLLARNQQYAALQASMQTLQGDFAVLKQRALDAENKCMTHQQTIAKLDMKLEQMRTDMSASRAEMEAVHEKLRQCMEELHDAQNRVTEGVVTLSMKDAVITTLRRELGKFGRFGRPKHLDAEGGSAFGEDENGHAGVGYTPETLQSIAAEVEACSQEARLKLTITELETNLKRAENESMLILRQHDNYMLHVENVIQSYEEQCMSLHDVVSAHRCVLTPFFTSSRYYRELAEMPPHMLLLMFPTSSDDDRASTTKSGDDADDVMVVPPATASNATFAQLAAESHRLRADLARGAAVESSDVELGGALGRCGQAYAETFGIGTELLGFLAILEDAVTRRPLTTTELRKEWERARVGYFVQKVASGMKESVQQLRYSMEEVAHYAHKTRMNADHNSNGSNNNHHGSRSEAAPRRLRRGKSSVASSSTRFGDSQRHLRDTDSTARDRHHGASESKHKVHLDDEVSKPIRHGITFRGRPRPQSRVRSLSASSRSTSVLSSARASLSESPVIDTDPYPLPPLLSQNNELCSLTSNSSNSSNSNSILAQSKSKSTARHAHEVVIVTEGTETSNTTTTKTAAAPAGEATVTADTHTTTATPNNASEEQANDSSRDVATRRPQHRVLSRTAPQLGVVTQSSPSSTRAMRGGVSNSTEVSRGAKTLTTSRAQAESRRVKETALLSSTPSPLPPSAAAVPP